MAQSRTALLPASQRPTPTSSVRLHTATLDQLDALRAPAESWEQFLVRTVLLPRNIQPTHQPRPSRRRRTDPDGPTNGPIHPRRRQQLAAQPVLPPLRP